MTSEPQQNLHSIAHVFRLWPVSFSFYSDSAPETRLKNPDSCSTCRDSLAETRLKRKKKWNWTNLKRKLIKLKTLTCRMGVSGALKLLNDLWWFELNVIWMFVMITKITEYHQSTISKENKLKLETSNIERIAGSGEKKVFTKPKILYLNQMHLCNHHTKCSWL